MIIVSVYSGIKSEIEEANPKYYITHIFERLVVKKPKVIKKSYNKAKVTEYKVIPIGMSVVSKPITCKITSRVSREIPKGYVALTFDDGPSKYTKHIVDILRKYRVHATFFFQGGYAQGSQYLVKYAAKYNMSVQNHSWTHYSFDRMSNYNRSLEISKTNKLLSKLTGKRVTLFRSPYGHESYWLKRHLRIVDMKLMLWNRDPQDWKYNNSYRIVQYFKNYSASGGVYVMHEKSQTVAALPDIIKYLKSKRLKLVVLR